MFVVDTDDDLATLETFPSNVQIRMRVTTAVRGQNGNELVSTVLGSSTVGEDTISPEIVITPPPESLPLMSPGQGDINVDPRTTIRMEFTEPVQPFSVGPLEGLSAPGSSSLIDISFGPVSSRTQMVYTVRPVSVFDLSTYEIIPGYSFPGAGPPGVQVHDVQPDRRDDQPVADAGGPAAAGLRGELERPGERQPVERVRFLHDRGRFGRGERLRCCRTRSSWDVWARFPGSRSST